MTQKAPQPPEKEFRAGTVSAAIWKTEANQDGRPVVRWSVKVQKRFQDQQTGEWRSSDYYYGSELADLAIVAQHAYEFIRLREAEISTELGAANG